MCKSELNQALSSACYAEPSVDFEKTCGPQGPCHFLGVVGLLLDADQSGRGGMCTMVNMANYDWIQIIGIATMLFSVVAIGLVFFAI